MVKGTTKRVIVVKSPDPKIFEQAIFIVREDYAGQGGASEILRQAQKVADDYLRSVSAKPPGLLARLPVAACVAVGAAIAGLVWLVLRLAGI